MSGMNETLAKPYKLYLDTRGHSLLTGSPHAPNRYYAFSYVILLHIINIENAYTTTK